MNDPVVFALGTCVTTDPATGLIVRMREGQTFAADDPIVIARPNLFTPRPQVRNVEQTTKAPGEKRGTKRGPTS